MTSLIALISIITLSVIASPVFAMDRAPSFSVAFYYASTPPLDELKAFDIVVVDPDAVAVSPVSYRTSDSELFSYVSVGEADPSRKNFAAFDRKWFIGDNAAWKTKVIDVSNPDWRQFFLDRIIEPLWQAGYRGFFLDTMDSYQIAASKKVHPAMEEGLVELLKGIKKRHPEARLILNRGFEIIPRARDTIFAVAAESLFRRFEPSTGKYGEVSEEDRKWLLARFAEVKNIGIPVISIDYVSPSGRDLARSTAERIKSLGFVPWVTDKDLSSIGVGSVEVVPRKILALYENPPNVDVAVSNLLRIAVTPLNYMGYQVDLHDIRKPLPEGLLSGRYAGVLVWPASDSSGQRVGLPEWVRRRMEEGVKLVFLERFGIPPQQFAKMAGLELLQLKKKPGKLDIVSRSPEMGFEVTPSPNSSTFLPLRSNAGRPMLTTGEGKKPLADPVAITQWGGYALEPYVVSEGVNGQIRWVINPFEFFRQAFRLPTLPAPDVTTENGLRLLLTHIDADGFESRVERAGAPYGATELRERILKKYRIPTTFSVITSSLGDRGVNKDKASELTQEARAIFTLPWIEAASHTFSHPFYWQDNVVARQGYDVQYLPIPGYSFNIDAEISGSVSFIDNNLLPPGKKTKLVQWSGDCVPAVDALEAVYRHGIGNINGGGTVITESSRTITGVAPIGVAKGGYFQVFAPNQNENVYTNLWTGPFYGYRRVIETFRLTDAPRRLKPINIYYHVYSATKEASRRALEDVYDWALAQRPNAIFTSEYFDKAIDFNRSVIAFDGKGWLIRNRGDLRELRMPALSGYPDLKASSNIIGFSDHNDSRYIHMGPGGQARLEVVSTPPTFPYLRYFGGRVSRFERTAKGLRLSVDNHIPTRLEFGQSSGCRLQTSAGLRMKSQKVADGIYAELGEGSHVLELICP